MPSLIPQEARGTYHCVVGSHNTMDCLTLGICTWDWGFISLSFIPCCTQRTSSSAYLSIHHSPTYLNLTHKDPIQPFTSQPDSALFLSNQTTQFQQHLLLPWSALSNQYRFSQPASNPLVFCCSIFDLLLFCNLYICKRYVGKLTVCCVLGGLILVIKTVIKNKNKNNLLLPQPGH